MDANDIKIFSNVYSTGENTPKELQAKGIHWEQGVVLEGPCVVTYITPYSEPFGCEIKHRGDTEDSAVHVSIPLPGPIYIKEDDVFKITSGLGYISIYAIEWEKNHASGSK